jgi:hypothetical protein
MTFTPSELALLAISDRAEIGDRWGRKRAPKGYRGKSPLGQIGQLTYEQAATMCRNGCSRKELARACGLSESQVGSWKCRHGLTKAYVRAR